LFPVLTKQIVNGVEQNVQVTTSDGQPMYWYQTQNVTLAYATPEFKIVAVKFTSEHGMLRPNVLNATPDHYNIGNAQTYKNLYADGTLQWNYARNASTGALEQISSVNVPITHTWGNASPAVPLTGQFKMMNFGATIQGKIYVVTNSSFTEIPPPTSGSFSNYNFDKTNDSNKIEKGSITATFAFSKSNNNNAPLLLSHSINQEVYWTFGTSAIDINVARMELAINNIFSGIISTDILEAIKNKLLVSPFYGFEKKNIVNSYQTSADIHIWNRANEGLVDCISHAEFYKRACKAIGMPADFGAQTLIAGYSVIGNPDLPKIAQTGSFGWEDIGHNTIANKRLLGISTNAKRSSGCNRCGYLSIVSPTQN
jgi:hypothetical protein